MKALTFNGIEDVQLETIADPIIEESHEVIVKVRLCAICGSDLHVYHGRESGCDHHTAMGHEFMGEIVEVGKDVRTLKRGYLVMSPFTTSCGSCFYCRSGLTARCVRSQLFGWRQGGKGLHGGQAEFVQVPLAEGTLMRVPDGVNDEEALLLGDILSTGFFSARQAALAHHDVVVVIGCGPVGLMAILGALHYGARKVFAVDTLPDRLAMAARLGAHALNASLPNWQEALLQQTEGRGADAVLEAVGAASAGRLAYELIRPGGTISTVGVCTDSHLAFSPSEAYNKNITFKVGRCPARFMMEQLVPLVQEHRYPFTSIITHRLALSEGVAGYQRFANREPDCLKILLKP